MAGDRQQIEEIKSKIDIVNLIDGYVKLKKAGQNYSGVCPFHQEKTPSFMVNPNIQRYKCFGCGEAGDIFTFIQKIENIEFYEALTKLAEQAGVTLVTSGERSKYAWLEELNEFAVNYYQKQLLSSQGKDALTYLKKRGLKLETIQQFKLGYAPSYNSLYKAIKGQFKSKYNDNQLTSSGLFTKKENGIRDKFVDRVMFPVMSAGGKIIGFSGRQTPKNTFGPKYLNTPETPLFHKSSILLGLHYSKNNIRRDDLAILCEGNLDVISAHQAGIDNILAPMGTSITAQQLELISRYTNNILFLFDSDKAGQVAVERGFKIAAGMGLNLYAETPDPYQDLDDLIQNDLKLAKKKIKPTVDAFTYLVSARLDEFDADSLQSHSQMRTYISGLLENIKDSTTKQFYLDKAYKLTKIDMREDGPQPTQATVARSTQPTYENKYNRTELRFLGLVLENNFFENLTKVQPKYFIDPNIRQAVTEITSSEIEDSKKLMGSDKVSDESKDVIESAIFGVTQALETETPPRDELNEIYQKLAHNYLDRRITSVSRHLATAEEKGDEEEITRLLELSDKLRLLKKERFSD